jgi:acyl carrier protein
METMTEQERALAAFFVEREGEGVLEVLREVNLLEDGLIDSLDMVSLAVFIEERFGRKLDLTDPATFQAMTRFDTLVRLATG